jgi:hypothetical protein
MDRRSNLWIPTEGVDRDEIKETAVSMEKHLIDETARVDCGSRGADVDIETCLACRHLEKYDPDSRGPFLVCSGVENASTARIAALA